MCHKYVTFRMWIEQVVASFVLGIQPCYRFLPRRLMIILLGEEGCGVNDRDKTFLAVAEVTFSITSLKVVIEKPLKFEDFTFACARR